MSHDPASGGSGNGNGNGNGSGSGSGSGSLVRAESPATSEASFSLSRGPTRSGRADDVDPAWKKDKAFRRYASGVDRALVLFDSSRAILNEWADYISFLSKLLKALHAHPPTLPIVPRRVVVAKRLAQCLNPALPSGVHQKCLEVYAYIFAMLPRDQLAADLPLYLPGIAPALTFASLSVRPMVLALFDQHLLQLDPQSIRPALRAVLLSLLPGLEDETSEDFEPALRIVDGFRQLRIGDNGFDGGDGTGYFWQTLFLVALASEERRPGVLAYMTRFLPKLGGDVIVDDDALPSMLAVTRPEPGLLVRCFAAGLTDRHVLVQRGFLDLLVTHLPLHSQLLLRDVTSEDMHVLVSAAVIVVTRRDMSLNRRLWSWFLGPSQSNGGDTNGNPHHHASNTSALTTDITSADSSASPSQYFATYGLKPLVAAIMRMIDAESDNPAERARPFRIALSLMDRWEIGSLIVPAVFLPIMRSTRQYRQWCRTQSQQQSKARFEEVFRSASAFFDGVESSLIFSELLQLMHIGGSRHAQQEHSEEQRASQHQQLVDDLVTAKFVLLHFDLTERDMLTVHLPLLLAATTEKLKELTGALEAFEASGHWRDETTATSLLAALDEATSIATTILTKVPDRAFASTSSASPPAPGATIGSHEQVTVALVLDYYERCKDSLEPPPPPVSSVQLVNYLLKQTKDLVFLAAYRDPGPNRDAFFRNWSNMFTTLLMKACRSGLSGRLEVLQTLYDGLLRYLDTTAGQPGQGTSVVVLLSIASLITSIWSMRKGHSRAKSRYDDALMSQQQLYEIVPWLARRLWTAITPSSPRHHVEIVRSLWLLHSVTWQHHLVQAAICSLMVGPDSTSGSGSHSLRQCLHISADQVEKFFVLWTHSHSSHIDSYVATAAALDQPGQVSKEDLRSAFEAALLDRPLFLVLDLLHPSSDDGDDETESLVRNWLGQSMLTHHVLRMILGSFRRIESSSTRFVSEETQAAIPSEAIDILTYALRTLIRVLSTLAETGWNALTDYATSGQLLSSLTADATSHEKSLQLSIVESCVNIYSRSALSAVSPSTPSSEPRYRLQKASLRIIQQLLTGPNAIALLPMHLESFLIGELSTAVDNQTERLQPALIDNLLLALRLASTAVSNTDGSRLGQRSPRANASYAKQSSESARSILPLSAVPGASFPDERVPDRMLAPLVSEPPASLMPCLLKSIKHSQSQTAIQKWMVLARECLPLYARGHNNFFQTTLKLVTAICERAEAVRKRLDDEFSVDGQIPVQQQSSAEHVALTLLTGLETCVAIAHAQLIADENSAPAVKTPEQSQSFFGNMVSGVFSSESSRPRSATANNRLTVILCIQDSVRLCFSVWSWASRNRTSNQNSIDPGSTASFQYSSLRLRGRARKFLENLLRAEPLETLEALIEIWQKGVSEGDPPRSRSVLSLLHTLDASQPKYTVPAVFNAIYTRTSPAALEASRKSSLSSRLTEAELAAFLASYARSLDEDVLDEIWTDCTTFLKDILGNTFPHRHILPRLMEFVVILGEKMQRTGFGDDRKARRDLADLLQRLLTATLTSRPLGSAAEPSTAHALDESPSSDIVGSDDIISILAVIAPGLASTLAEPERVNGAMMSISTNIISPIFHSRLFPQNVHGKLLDLLMQTGKISGGNKHFRKDVADAFNDPKFFSMRIGLVQTHWLKVLGYWSLVDKDRLIDLLQRIPQAANAGIMFGVGAAAARLEADRKVQATLRRVALLILATEDDNFSADTAAIHQKLIDLLNTTFVSSPSSATRAEVYMVLRALMLKTSAVHLAPLWPLVSDELRRALSRLAAVAPDDEGKHAYLYNPYSLLQASKLLELLLDLSPDDFQTQQWLFVNDTIDAIYPPSQGASSGSAGSSSTSTEALADLISQSLRIEEGLSSEGDQRHSPAQHSSTSNGKGDSAHADPMQLVALTEEDTAITGPAAAREQSRHGFLTSPFTREVAKDEIVEQILQPFYKRLSIRAFEGTYSMLPLDMQAYKYDLIADIFNEFTMAG